MHDRTSDPAPSLDGVRAAGQANVGPASDGPHALDLAAQPGLNGERATSDVRIHRSPVEAPRRWCGYCGARGQMTLDAYRCSRCGRRNPPTTGLGFADGVRRRR